MRTWSRSSNRASVRTFDRAESGLPPVASDPYFYANTLLLPGNGTNGAQNNTFVDSSTNAFTITRNGNTTQGTFSPFSQTGWSNYFDGSGDYLTAPNNAAFDFGSGDFTIELWFYPTTVSGFQGFCGKRANSPSYGPLSPGISNGAVWLLFSTSGSSWAVNTTGGVLVANQWYHVAIVRSGTSLKAYLNGTEIISTTLSGALVSNSVAFSVGSMAADGGDPFSGYISNFRAIKGTAVYTANFTPSTTPLMAISGTSLLTCQSNRFIDNSSNAFAITRNGDVSVQAFSPFNPTAAWSAATNGGSGYFDGTGDYLSVAASANQDFGSSAFTVEFWWYSVPNSGRQWFYHASTDYWFGVDVQNSGGLGIWASSNGSSWDLINSDPGGNGRSNVQPQRQAWNHIAVGRSSGTWSVWLNGTRVLNLTGITGAIVSRSAQAKIVGGWAAGSQYLVNGYLSNFRVVIGTDVYGVSNSTITVPTAPLTAITNTQILLNTTNAGIYDATAKNDLETVGNAQISTTQSQWGGSSMYFDGTGDYLISPVSSNLSFGAGDFTIEMWVYIVAHTNLDGRPLANHTSWASNNWSLHSDHQSHNEKFSFWVNNYNASSALLVSTTTVATATWYHLAITRSGNNWRMFVDGTQEGSTVSSSASMDGSVSKPVYVGGGTAANEAINGYIQDLRITKGYARYTTGFTPPTAAFPLT